LEFRLVFLKGLNVSKPDRWEEPDRTPAAGGASHLVAVNPFRTRATPGESGAAFGLV